MLALSQCPGISPIADSSAALQAALNRNEPLTWDCQVLCVMGTDASKAIFVPDKSDVTFTANGSLVVDNQGFPALTFYAVNGTWRDLYIRYRGTAPISAPQSAHVWNDEVLRNYLIARKYHTFAPGTNPYWGGTTNVSAVVAILAAADVTVDGGAITVDDGVPACEFAPTGVWFGQGFKEGAVTPSETLVGSVATINNFLLDGVIMGFVGQADKVTLTGITRKRYADLQDAKGQNVGGVNDWFAPPHMFYLYGNPGYPMITTLKDIVDLGEFTGNPIRRSTGSGFMHSCKISLDSGSSVDGYYSRCPDGLFGILTHGATTGGSIKNATAIIDETIKSVDGKNACTGGIFFPNAAADYPPSIIDLTIYNNVPSVNPIGNTPKQITVSARIA
jgi:hypothetical protein